jgi:hypothetical protein
MSRPKLYVNGLSWHNILWYFTFKGTLTWNYSYIFVCAKIWSVSHSFDLQQFLLTRYLHIQGHCKQMTPLDENGSTARNKIQLRISSQWKTQLFCKRAKLYFWIQIQVVEFNSRLLFIISCKGFISEHCPILYVTCFFDTVYKTRKRFKN